MSYEKENWVNGQPPAISADKLTKIENGIINTINSIPSLYTIYKIDSTYYAKANFDGGTDYSGTDAATVIQSVIDNLPPQGGVISGNPSQTFDITKMITISEFGTPYGRGGMIVLRNFNLKMSGALGALLKIYHSYNVYLDNIRIDGNSDGGSIGYGLFIDSSYLSEFHNIRFKNMYKEAVQTNNAFTNCTTLQFKNVHIYGVTTSAGMRFRYVKGLSLEDVTVEHIATAGMSGIVIDNCGKIRAVNIWVEDAPRGFYLVNSEVGFFATITLTALTEGGIVEDSSCTNMVYHAVKSSSDVFSVFSGSHHKFAGCDFYGKHGLNSGIATFSGDGATITFNIAHGLVATPSSYQVQEASADAGTAEISHVTADSTNLIVTFKTAPASGTDNVKLAWSAEV